MKKPELPPSSENHLNEAFNNLPAIIQDSDLINRITTWEDTYPYWDKFKYLANSESFSPEVLWNYLKIQRSFKAIQIKIHDTAGFHFHYNVTKLAQTLLHKFDMNLGGNLEGASIIPAEKKETYLINSIMEEAIASSQLEGAVTTREVAKKMLRTKRKPRDHSEKMILNNYNTIKELLKLKDRELSKDLILSIHSLITKNTLDKSLNEGMFRKNNEVQVTDVNDVIFYDPPSYDKLETLIKSYCKFANTTDASQFIHPIIKAIILHFLMGYIHPFVDGNGRTARAIFYWFMLKKGYWLTEYMTISRIIIKSPAQYAKAYLHTEYDNNDLTYFINYHLKSMDLAFAGLKEFISRKQKQKKDSFRLLKKQDVNPRQALVLQEFLLDPEMIYTFKELQGKFNVTYQTARTDLMDLVTKGLIEKTQQGKAFYFYRSDSFEKKLEL